MEQRLVEIGEWLKVNGEAIYDSTPAAWSCQYTQGLLPRRQMGLDHSFQVAYRVMDMIGQEPKNGIAMIELFYTTKKVEQVAFLYAISVAYPQGKLTIRNVQISSETQVHMLGYPEELLFEFNGSDLEILVPLLHPKLVPCSHAYSFRVSHAILKPEPPHPDL
jgi:alpha-L-fucosidase